MRDPRALPDLRTQLALVVMVALVSVTLPRALPAQVSPGPLARAHASLDVPLGCANCHAGRRESMDRKCLACHREIAALKEEQRGYHSRGEAARGTCAGCHPDHAGRDFALIEWPQKSPERFEHLAAGWTLDGKHAAVTCTECHTASYRVDASAKLAPGAGGPRWAGLNRRCTSCHEDPHRPTLGATCMNCHDMEGWTPAPGFDHDESSYRLTGEHRQVECAACHLAPRLRPRRAGDGHLVPVFKPVPAAGCADCHADPHKNPTMTRCASCHVTTGFRTIKTGAFDHARTRFPLVGEHRDVGCAQCHIGYPRTVTRPAFSTCATCHADPHGGQATLGGRVVDCAACHRVDGFAPATFTVAQHQATKYPLVGRHAAARCNDCHRHRTAASAVSATGIRAVADLRPSFTSCTSCHIDPHRSAPTTRTGDGRVAGGIVTGTCESCHGLDAFRPSTLDLSSHARFDFVLEGGHRTVPCADCHRELRASSSRTGAASLVHSAAARRAGTPLTLAAPTACASCHATPHGQQFATRRDRGACESCHGLEAFRPANRFDHDRDTRFALAPAHTRVPCAACHVPPARRSDPVVYRGTVVRCEQCHSGGRR